MEDFIYVSSVSGKIVKSTCKNAVKYARVNERTTPMIGDIFATEEGIIYTITDVKQDEEDCFSVSVMNAINIISCEYVLGKFDTTKTHIANEDEKMEYFKKLIEIIKREKCKVIGGNLQ